MDERQGLRPTRFSVLFLASILLFGDTGQADVSLLQTPDLTPDVLLRNIAARSFTGKPVTIRVTRDNVASAIEAIQKVSGLTLVVDPHLYETIARSSPDRDVIRANEMPWDALLDALMREFRLGILVQDGKLVLRREGGDMQLVAPPVEAPPPSRTWVVLLVLLAVAGITGGLIMRKMIGRGRSRPRFALEAEAAEEIKAKILYLFEVEKIHHDEDLSLQNLSARLSLPAHHLSWVFNEVLGSSFSRFVNTYRINEVKKLLGEEGEAGRTILEIAFEAGFGTKTAFNKVFKEHTGMTPSEFREKRRS